MLKGLDTNMGIARAASREPEKVSWLRLSNGLKTLINLQSSGSMVLLGQGNQPLHKPSQEGCLLMVAWEHHSSVQGDMRTAVISNSSSPHWQFNLHGSTQVSGLHSSPSSDPTLRLPMSHFKNRWTNFLSNPSSLLMFQLWL